MNHAFAFLIVVAAFTPHFAWCGGKPKSPRDCAGKFVDSVKGKKRHVLTDASGRRHSIRLYDLVVFYLIHDDPILPNPMHGEVTHLSSHGVTLNDFAYIPWSNINLVDVSVLHRDETLPAYFSHVAETLADHLELRSRALKEDPRDPWRQEIFRIYNTMRYNLATGILITKDEVPAALDLLIKAAAQPGGQPYVDLLETHFYLLTPENKVIPWPSIFGETDLSQNGLNRLGSLKTNLTTQPQ